MIDIRHSINHHRHIPTSILCRRHSLIPTPTKLVASNEAVTLFSRYINTYTQREIQPRLFWQRRRRSCHPSTTRRSIYYVRHRSRSFSRAPITSSLSLHFLPPPSVLLCSFLVRRSRKIEGSRRALPELFAISKISPSGLNRLNFMWEKNLTNSRYLDEFKMRLIIHISRVY